jgi:hypothetical protein
MYYVVIASQAKHYSFQSESPHRYWAENALKQLTRRRSDFQWLDIHADIHKNRPICQTVFFLTHTRPIHGALMP